MLSSGKTSWTMEAVTLLRAFHFNEKQNVDLFYCSDTKGTAHMFQKLFEYRLWNPKISEKCFFAQFIWLLLCVYGLVWKIKQKTMTLSIFSKTSTYWLVVKRSTSPLLCWWTLSGVTGSVPSLHQRLRQVDGGVGPVFPLITLSCMRMWVTVCDGGISPEISYQCNQNSLINQASS